MRRATIPRESVSQKQFSPYLINITAGRFSLNERNICASKTRVIRIAFCFGLYFSPFFSLSHDVFNVSFPYKIFAMTHDKY